MSVNISHFFPTSLQPPAVNSSKSESSSESSGTPTSPNGYPSLNLRPTQSLSIHLPEKSDIGSNKFKDLINELTLTDSTSTDLTSNEQLIKQNLSDEPKQFLIDLITFLQKQIKKNIQNSRRKLITVLLFTKKNYPELLKKAKISRRLLLNSLEKKFQLNSVLNRGTFKTAYLAVDPNTHQYIVLLLQRLQRKDLPQILHELSVGDMLQLDTLPSFTNSYIITLNNRKHLISQVTKANVFNVNENKFDSKLSPWIILSHITQQLKELNNTGFVHNDVKLSNILITDAKATLTDFGLSFNSDNYNHLSLCQIGGTYRSPWYTKLSSENSIEKLQKNSNLSLQSFLEKGEIFSWAVMVLTLFFPDFNHPYKGLGIYYDSSENNPILLWVKNFNQAFYTYVESKKKSGSELSLNLLPLGRLLSRCLSTDYLMKDTYLPKPTYPDWNEILLLVQFLNPPAALKLRSI